MKVKIIHLLTFTFLLFGMLLPTQTVFAATINVESAADGAANAAHCPGAACTLRDAVAKASPGDTIRFNLPATPADITLTHGEIFIGKNLTIQGPGSADLTISGNLASRIFGLDSVTVAISGMTLLDGRVVDNYGGAIFSRGNLTLDDMIITQNGTTANLNTYLNGGGIYQGGGSLTITNSQITENYAAYNGGGLAVLNAPLSMTNVIVYQNQTNQAIYSSGGGIYIQDSDPNDNIAVINVTLNQVSVLNNITYGGGGGVNINGAVTLTLSHVTIQENETITNYGGGIFAYDSNRAVTVNITNNSIIQGNLANGASGNGGGISTNGSLTVTDSSLINNSASDDGGGIFASGNGSSVTLTNATLSGNQSKNGAGIYATNITTLNINGSTFTGNQAQQNGGGLYYSDPDGHTTIQDSTVSNNQAITGSGGGLYTGGDVSIEDTTVSGNSSLYEGGGQYYHGEKTFTLNRVTISGNSTTGDAAGLSLTIYNAGTGSITNSTISGNSSTNGTGGVFASADTSVLFNHVTIAGNTSANYLGGFRTAGANVSIKNSIIADNTGGGMFTAFPDCLGTIHSQDYNLIEKMDLSCTVTGTTTHNITGQDPKLDTLKDNGGSTLTLNLLPGSPAIDPAGNTSCLTEDQRGIKRPQDGDVNGTASCDIGAVEIKGPVSVLSIIRANANPSSASNVNFTVDFSEDVTGVDADGSDFQLFTSGVTGASITGVTPISASVYTVSINTGSGNGTLRLDIPNTATIKDTSNNDLSGLPSTSGEVYDIDKTILSTSTLTSTATQDGQVLETTETSGKGGTIDSTSTRINLGDDAANKQYRAILSFDTSSLPDNAVITSVTLKFKYAGKTGTLPFSTHGNLMADIRKGPFSNNAALQANDFKAAASKNNVLSFSNSMVSNWFSQSLDPANFQYVNLTNVTQFRLRFQTDDNHDFGADLLKIFSSNAGVSGRPKLIIEYYVP